MDDISLYAGREATWVKHEVLRQYLQRLAYKIGWWHDAINYIDGFAGPWRANAENLSDTSPHIAIRELRAARDGLSKAGQSAPSIRCFFVEKAPDACQRLRESVTNIQDIRIYVRQGEFEQHIQDALDFASNISKSFTFFFIDPTGWTGFGMQAIAPVLRHKPGEVLINFMTKDIKRFIDDPTSVALPAFKELFGTTDYRANWHGLAGQDREDEIVETYCHHVQEVGGFKHVVSAVILHPTDRRTHFHLIYGTRSDDGLRTFREVESKTMEVQEQIRAAAQQSSRIQATRQLELFGADTMGSGGHYESLRKRYTSSSRSVVQALLMARRRVLFDELEVAALAMPMTWPKDVQNWLREWKNQGAVQFEGLAQRERTLKVGCDHYVIWTK